MNLLLATFLKGLAMGAANVIPGVSGGTIALITGIYERLINAIKKMDITAARLVVSGKLSDAWQYIDGTWLAALMAGLAVSIVSLAKVFELLLIHYETFTMAFFFGLILLSIIYVAKDVKRWQFSSIACLVLGTLVAVAIATLAPATQNENMGYVFLCGVIAISSMILPGLSGSFVLILLGNYTLVLGAISSFNMAVLVPLAAGCAVGLIVFSHILSWVFTRFADQTLALMTGFVVGSLVVIWPWKTAVVQTITREGKEPREIIASYEWFAPALNEPATWTAIVLMILGAACIAIMARAASTK